MLKPIKLPDHQLEQRPNCVAPVTVVPYFKEEGTISSWLWLREVRGQSYFLGGKSRPVGRLGGVQDPRRLARVDAGAADFRNPELGADAPSEFFEARMGLDLFQEGTRSALLDQNRFELFKSRGHFHALSSHISLCECAHLLSRISISFGTEIGVFLRQSPYQTFGLLSP